MPYEPLDGAGSKTDGTDEKPISEFVRGFIKDWWDALAPAVGAVAGFIAAIGVPDGLAKILTWLATAALVAIATVVLSLKRSRRKADKERKRRVEQSQDRLKGKGLSSFRGLSPFGYGDFLPGPQRRREAATIATQIVSKNLSFIIVAGDIGAGKTSLLTAGIAAELESVGEVDSKRRFVAILPTPFEEWQGGRTDALSVEKALDLIKNWTLRSFERAADRDRFLIIDQFEQVFIRFRSKQERGAIGRFIEGCINGIPSTTIICGVRKDYVADFHDLAPALPSPLTAQNTFLIGNLSVPEAAEVIRECAVRDQIEMPGDMPRLLAEDLAEREEVRAAELQIVCTALRGNFQIEQYREAGGAYTILSRYVALVIDTNKRPIVARLALRSLCDFLGGAKAPSATVEEILLAITPDQGVPIISFGELQEILSQLEEDKLIVSQRDGNDRKYSLIHDYLVEPIKLATQDVSTRVDEAAQIIKGYLADERARRRPVIPLNRISFIRRYAPRDLMSSSLVRRLIRRSYVAAYGRPIGIALAAILATIIVGIAFGTKSGWNLRADARIFRNTLSSLATLQSIDTSKGLAVLGSDGGQTVIWSANDGRELLRSAGMMLASNKKNVLLFEKSRSGSSVLKIVDTNEWKEKSVSIPGPPSFFPAAWIDEDFAFLESGGIRKAVNLITAAIIELPAPGDRSVGAWGWTSALIDQDRILVLSDKDRVPMIWSISSQHSLAILKSDADAPNAGVAWILSPERTQVVTAEIVPEGATQASKSQIRLAVWDITSDKPTVVHKATIPSDEIESQMRMWNSVGVRVLTTMWLTMGINGIALTVSIANPSTPEEFAAYTYGRDLSRLDVGLRDRLRGVLADNKRPLAYFEMNSPILIMRDLVDGKELSFKEWRPNGRAYLSLEGRDSDYLMASMDNGNVELWSMENRARVRTFTAKNLRSAFVTLGDPLVAALLDGGYLKLWSLSGSDLGDIPGIAGGNFPVVSWSAERCELLVWSGEGKIFRFKNEWNVLGLFSVPKQSCLS